jgi:hypothetical protein
VIQPEVFFVQGKEGPLALGEKDKAIAWAGRIRTAAEGNV